MRSAGEDCTEESECDTLAGEPNEAPPGDCAMLKTRFASLSGVWYFFLKILSRNLDFLLRGTPNTQKSLRGKVSARDP